MMQPHWLKSSHVTRNKTNITPSIHPPVIITGQKFILTDNNYDQIRTPEIRQKKSTRMVKTCAKAQGRIEAQANCDPRAPQF